MKDIKLNDYARVSSNDRKESLKEQQSNRYWFLQRSCFCNEWFSPHPNKNTWTWWKEDLMKDLISIIYSFSARMYGLRRKKNKQDIIKFIEN